MQDKKVENEVKSLVWKFMKADRSEAYKVKRQLSGKASMAKQQNRLDAYNIYSRAARRLKTPKV